MERDIRKRMELAEIYPSEGLGQHILINESALEVVTGNTARGGNVLEIGAGPGNITERIAKVAKNVVAVEIDRKFEPVLSELQLEYPNVEVVYNDILNLNLGNLMKGGSFDSEWQIMASLPFHITEPFLKQIIDLPISEAILILGKQMADRIQIDNPINFDFTRTGLTVQTFFDSSRIMDLPSNYFYPEPGTDSAVVVLTPRNRAEFKVNRKLAILRRLFLTEKRHSPIGKVIKEAYGKSDDDVLRGKEERNRYDRRQLRRNLKLMTRNGGYTTGNGTQYNKYDNGERLFSKLGLSDDILGRPFSNLDNQDLRELVLALDKI